MTAAPANGRRSCVLIGAGHAHVEVLRDFGERPPADVALTVVSPYVRVPYSGMAPGYIAGKYRFDEATIDAEALARKAGATLIASRAVSIDREARLVHCENGATAPYDIASIDIGGRGRQPLAVGPDAPMLLPVKPVEPFIAALDALLADAKDAEIALVGAGFSGIELAAAIAGRGARATLITGESGIAPRAPSVARRAVAKRLARRGVRLIEGARAVAAERGAVVLADGRRVAARAVILTIGVGPPAFIEGLDLPKDAHGFLALAATLQSQGDARIFAAGDSAGITYPGTDELVQKAGVFAVRQGPVLARNLRAALEGASLAPYHPQKDFLAILTFWPDGAVALRNGLAVEGRWVDRWKTSIDKKFMAKYSVSG